MTVAAVVPLVLYMVHLVTRGFSRPQRVPSRIASDIAYLVGQLAVLAVAGPAS